MSLSQAASSSTTLVETLHSQVHGKFEIPPAAAAKPISDPASKDHDIPLKWGAVPERSECPDSASYVWVRHVEGDDCIRYFAGADMQSAPVVIVMFSGDRDGALRRDPEDIRNNTRKLREGAASRLTRRAGTPVVLVARPGTYGSTGDHRLRRRSREFVALDAGLSAIRNRYRIGQFVLMGHSGGATAAAALLTLRRRDIRCAVLTSGAFGLAERAKRLADQRGEPRPTDDVIKRREYFDPLDEIDRIVLDEDRRIYVLGHPRDTITHFDQQRKFADAVARAGHHVELRETPASAPHYHDLLNSSGLSTAVECAK